MRYGDLGLGSGTSGGEGEGLFGTVDHPELLLVKEVGVGDEVVVCGEARFW